MTHSDNIATDIATAKVGADPVRALIAQAGLPSIRIPDTTRRFASYLLGAPAGVDLGWPGIVQALQNPPGPLRPPLNDVITLAGTARDFVSWYEQVLQGALFAEPETLTEFKRIQAMSEQIAKAVPPDTPAYAKGGESVIQRLQRQELRRADRGRWWGKHAGDVLLRRELERTPKRLPGDRGRVLRGHQGHPRGHQADPAVTATRLALTRRWARGAIK